MEIERFNDLCVRFSFTEEAIARLRDVRRKGKNRQAARKSREKKIKTMDVLRLDSNHILNLCSLLGVRYLPTTWVGLT